MYSFLLHVYFLDTRWHGSIFRIFALFSFSLGEYCNDRLAQQHHWDSFSSGLIECGGAGSVTQVTHLPPPVLLRSLHVLMRWPNFPMPLGHMCMTSPCDIM